MSENNRRHERHDIQIKISLTLIDNPIQLMKTRDLSDGGMFIATDTPSDFPLGEMVHIEYKNPLAGDAETEVDAVIVRIANNGVGVAFVDMAAF